MENNMDWKYEKGRIYFENECGELMAETTYETMVNGGKKGKKP